VSLGPPSHAMVRRLDGMSSALHYVRFVAIASLSVQTFGAMADDAPSSPSVELDDCVASLVECVAMLAAGNTTGSTDEEEVAFSILGSWMKQLYTKKEAPLLAEDLMLRASVLGRLQELAVLSVSRPSLAIGVGQMMFLYFWWGVHPPPGGELGGQQPTVPCAYGLDLGVGLMALELHSISLSLAGCDNPATSSEEFDAKKCPWRWRFVLLFLAEVGRKLLVDKHDVIAGTRHLKLAKQRLASMKSLPFFASHQSLIHGPRWANQNDDYLPRARHWPVWPRDRWPSFAHFLEANAHVFLMDLLNLLQADEGDELFRTVQEPVIQFRSQPAP